MLVHEFTFLMMRCANGSAAMQRRGIKKLFLFPAAQPNFRPILSRPMHLKYQRRMDIKRHITDDFSTSFVHKRDDP